jgi:hypothetical protein
LFQKLILKYQVMKHNLFIDMNSSNYKLSLWDNTTRLLV